MKKINTIDLSRTEVEISDFCRAIYASTQNEQERNIYFNMLDKLNKTYYYLFCKDFVVSSSFQRIFLCRAGVSSPI